MRQARALYGVALVAGLLLATDGIQGAPVIQIASALVQNVAVPQLVLSGTGFGIKTQAAPIRWEDFESGSSGQELPGWTIRTSHSIPPRLSGTRVHAGALAARMDYTGAQYNCSALLTGLRETEMYLTYWAYVDHINGDVTRNLKLARLSTTDATGDFVHGTPYVAYGEGANANGTFGQWFVNSGSLTAADNVWITIPRSGWIRMEMYVKLSTPDVADGRRRFYYNRIPATAAGVNDDRYTTLRSSAYKQFFENVALGIYVDHAPGGDYAIYYDDVFVDRGLSRVELCDTPTWPNGGAGGHCEIQIPTSWSTGTIRATLNRGSFTSLSTLYAYVVDADGAVNTNGVRLVTDAPVPPGPPRAVVVR